MIDVPCRVSLDESKYYLDSEFEDDCSQDYDLTIEDLEELESDE